MAKGTTAPSPARSVPAGPVEAACRRAEGAVAPLEQPALVPERSEEVLICVRHHHEPIVLVGIALIMVSILINILSS